MSSFGEQGDLLELNKDGFDFSLQFEQLFFSIIPSVLFIVFSLWRSLSQARKPTVVDAPVFQLIKLTSITAYVGLELSLVILVAIGTFSATGMFIASSVLKLVSAFAMILLSLIDHRKSLRPSVLLNSYLFLTLLLDLAQARTLFLTWTVKPELAYSSIFTATIAVKLGILLLEAQRKSKWVIWNEKEHSPEETSGIFSLGVFFWLNKIFLEGYHKVLKVEDLFPLDTSLRGNALHGRFSRNMDYSKLKNSKFGLVKVLARTLTVPLLLPVLPRLALLGFTFCQPLFIERLLDHLSKPKIDDNIGYGLICASILIYTGIAISMALCWYFHNRLRSMIRSILVIETYRKATQSRIGVSDDNAGITLMSTDIERIHLGLLPLHDIWAAVIQAALAGYMLYGQLGIVFVAPMAVVAFCVAGLMLLMNFAGDSQRAWMNGVQKRVGLTATVIGNMKTIKMSGLVGPVSTFVQKLRVDELAAGAKFRKIYIVAALLGFIPLLLSPPLTLAFAQRKLDATRMFTSLAYLLLLTTPLSDIFQMVPQLMSSIACLGRIQSFLECETRSDYRNFLSDAALAGETPTDSATSAESTSIIDDAFSVDNGSFGWKENSFALKDINLRIAKSSLTIVVGAVGSGKSTLAKALLGEIPYMEGNVSLSNRRPHVGFCDQTAFLFNGTIRDNIVGFSSFDPQRYTQVINATVLGYDFAALPQGDQTCIGSDGITLSGGQKQRVALARALYLQSDLLILDDVFSGLDADTEEQVFRRVFGTEGLLRERRTTVVLCTHSVRHLPAADHIVALADGTIAEQGNFTALMAHPGYVHSIGLNTSSETDSDIIKSSLKDDANDSKFELNVTSLLTASATPDDDGARQNGDRSVYKHYCKSVGSVFVLFSLFFATLWGFFTNFPTIWLKFWTDDVYSENPEHSYSYYSGIYALLNVCGLISLLLLGITIFIIFIKKAGANLHHDALRTLIHAPLRFFTTTDTGVVTNFFSQDLNLVDTELPSALLSTLFSVFQALGQAAVMVTSSPFVAISYPFLIALLWVVQKFYLRTSRQLRLLDLETKSPLYTHFLDTRKGIATLRAFGFVAKDIEKNARLVDTSQRPAYLLVMIQQWLNLVLNLIVMVIAAILTCLAVRLHSNTAFTGASLVTLMNFGDSLSGIIIWWTKLETSIGAVARLKAFNEKVEPEDKEYEDLVPAEHWPQNGAVELKDVSASYDPENCDNTSNIALRGINLRISPREKVAICGRTGSGKSSLIALLLKLLDPLTSNGGEVAVDDTPLHRIDRPTLRQRILAVPQEAVFLPDGTTFKVNLDPLNVSSDEECESVLTKVGLWQYVQDVGGLDAGMNPETLSAGQRQLMSLGRVLLRRRIRARQLGLTGQNRDSGVLLLDEVSSNVDHETERVMQEIIRAEFENYTVIAVSHRLDMIMDFDRVVVMDTGEIVEVGVPAQLAEESGSRFGELVKAGSK
ncbi:related to multidrug resistance protein [Fusarium torulosum]|uniref:Related to multidrug resistance protein n=1 Tax=Fusarium torulosum TaxID=33205 RepID=A0AAE8MBK3_9HYPO|nr:related to multidrug resistance protein [Fusarium torulosum]